MRLFSLSASASSWDAVRRALSANVPPLIITTEVPRSSSINLQPHYLEILLGQEWEYVQCYEREKESLAYHDN